MNMQDRVKWINRKMILLLILAALLCCPLTKGETLPMGHDVKNVQQSFVQREPFDYDLRHMQALNLADADGLPTEQYLHAEAVYLEVLAELLKDRLGLQLIDQAIAAAEEEFLLVPQEEQEPYQLRQSFGMQFIYLRNNCHIERLAEDDLALLLARTQQPAAPAGDKEMGPSDESAEPDAMQEMVERTWKQLIRVDFPENKAGNYNVVYRIDAIMQTGVPNNALVLVIATEPAFDEKGNYVNRNHEAAKQQSLQKLARALEGEAEKELDIPVCVFLR